MKISTFKPLFFVATFMLSAVDVHALDLGLLKIESDLGQPLKGEIELIVTEEDDLSLINVSLASEAEFKKYRVDYSDYLKDVRLSLINNVLDPLLVVDSNGAAINEPFIRFLARVKLPGGVFFREFTAIIDAPIYSEEPSSLNANPPEARVLESGALETAQGTLVEGSQPSEVTFEANKAVDENVSFSNVTQQSSFQGDASYGPVVSGESLSGIALGLKAKFPDLNVYQIMKVLFEENQSAFIDGNINGLLKGSVLKVSDLSVIRSADVSESINFYIEQINAWDETSLIASSNNEALRVGQDNYIDSANQSDTKSSAANGDTDSGRFQVGASSEVENLVSSGEGSGREGEVLALRKEASKLETSLASIELEKKELNERVEILEGQLSDINSLIELNLESSELAALEGTLKHKKEAKNNSKNEPTKASDSEKGFFSSVAKAFNSVVDLTKEAAVGLGEYVSESWSWLKSSITGSDINVDKPQAPTTNPVSEGLDAVKAVEGLKNKSSAEKENATVAVLKNLFFGGGLWKVLLVLGGILSIGLAALFFRNRREDNELEGALENNDSAEQSALSDDSAGTDVPFFLTQYNDGEAGAQNDDIDSAEAADVYIAYGRDEQAEEVLLSGIVSEPERVDIKQKLLGLYFKRSNTKGFENMAEQLHLTKDTLSENEWQEIIKMGQEIAPKNPLFVSSEAGHSTVIDADTEAQYKNDEAKDSLLELKESNASNNDLKQIDATNSSLEGEEPEGNRAHLDDFMASISGGDRPKNILKTDFNDNNPIVDTEKLADKDSDKLLVSNSGVESDYDEAQTQFQLAKVFVDLGDENGARKILLELIGNDDNDESLLTDSKKLLDSIKR